MIYIDPPYNTGKDFVYSDKFSVSKMDNAIAEGNASEDEGPYQVNSNTGGAYHATWLSMMYPRLRLAKNLLKDDGVIFISIDDIEVANLRALCDEIFGEENFVANLIWEKKFSPQNDAKWFSDNHDHILVYSKNKEDWRPNLLPRTEESNARYKNSDNDPRGDWTSGDLLRKDVQKSGVYTIITPNGNKYDPPSGRSWRVSESKYLELVKDNRIWFGNEGGNVPRIKRFLSEVQDGMKPVTILSHSEVGHNQEASQELKKIFEGKSFFDTPKPVRLLYHMEYLSTKENDIILDFFSGSSTTAHAVMQLNEEDGGNRKYIMVQYPEEYPSTSEAAKAGYGTITDIGKERIRRAGEKIKEEAGEKAKNLDIGFRVFKTDDTNVRWIAEENGMKASQTQLDGTTKSGKDRRDFMPDATDIDVAYEILLRQYDIPLSAPMETLSDIGERTYCFADAVVVCLEEVLTEEIIDKIAAIEPMPHKVVFRDSAFGKDINLKLNTMARFDAMMKKHGEKTKQPYTVEFL